MTNHPRQREMWDGLDGSGCLGFILLIIIVTLIGVFVS
jgi:hypothetical protein